MAWQSLQWQSFAIFMKLMPVHLVRLMQYLKSHSSYSRSAYLAAHAPAPAPIVAAALVKGYAINVASDTPYTATDGTVYLPDQ